MIASLDQIKELIRGEVDELVIEQKPPKIGQVVPVQPGVGKRAKCRARILDHWPHRDGGYVVQVEHLHLEVAPRFLARQAGKLHPPQYTTSQLSALPDEPEAVPDEWEAEFALSAEQGKVLRGAEARRAWEEEAFMTRLEEEIIEAERLGIDPGREMARLEAGLSALARRNAMAKQQRRKAA